jgi:hypothetical protein
VAEEQEFSMKASKFTESQIAFVLKQARKARLFPRSAGRPGSARRGSI